MNEWERLRGLGGEEKDGTEECYHGDGRTSEYRASQSVDTVRLSYILNALFRDTPLAYFFVPPVTWPPEVQKP